MKAFTSFSGDEIARRYASPYMAMHADGTRSFYSSAQDIAHYFQRVVDAYNEQGARTCRYKDLDAIALGRSHLLATVTWELLDQTGGIIGAWRESYSLVLSDREYKITTSIDH